MNPIAMILNAARRLDALFPGYFSQTKHNHYRDFGWPEHVTFDMVHAAYCRSSLARAAIDKTILKTWQDNPELWETQRPAETQLEADIRRRFADLRLWSRMAECDRRAMVGGYAGLILRLRDDRSFSEPVDRVPGALDGLAEVIPAWAGQLTVATWNTDPSSEGYGLPTMFRFNETAVGGDLNRVRHFDVHPDRVLIWSADGTVHARSMLEPGYNDLIDAEKVKGAGGEGFWKNARSAPVFEVDKELDLARMAAGMGVEPDRLADAMNAQIEDFQKGFDKLLLLQGMQAKTLGITLPSPEHFFGIAVNSFAASFGIPVKILVGNQVGERASTEDAREWARTNNARREMICRPLIVEFVSRLERFGMLPKRDWHVAWSDLTEDSQGEKINRAEIMARINQMLGMEPAFAPEEIRAVAGYDDALPERGDQ